MSSASDVLATRVFLRPIGSPISLGVAGLAIATLVQSGFDLHWVARDQATAEGLVLVAVPFVLQALACVFSYLARDGAGGSVLGVLAVSWLAIGLVRISSLPGHRSGAIGLMSLAVAGLVLLGAASVSIAKPLPATLFAIAGTRFALAGIYELGGPATWRDAAGIAGLVVVALAAYCALAFELEDQASRAVLPTFRRGRGLAAVSAAPGVAMDDVVHEPGVRQTT